MGLRRTIRRLRYVWNARKRLQCVEKTVKSLLQERASGKLLKLHVGCGTIYLPGWVNIDNNSDSNIERLDLNYDIRYPLPFPDGSVDFIFNEHFLEHLTVEEGQRVIKEFLRVLTPSRGGGVLRIAMPDLKSTIAAYNDPDWKEQPDIKRFHLDFIQTRAELLNISFRWWGHQWLYDWEELERRLREAGGQTIERCAHSESRHPELRNLENRAASTLIAEVVKS